MVSLDVYGEVVSNVQSGPDSPVQSGGLGPLLDRFLSGSYPSTRVRPTLHDVG